jgi:hypothetical protein
MATRTSKTSTVKAKSDKTSAPKVGRARKVGAGAAAMAATTLESAGSDEIAARAYERFCARGYVHGFDVDDWLAAERELRSRA